MSISNSLTLPPQSFAPGNQSWVEEKEEYLTRNHHKQQVYLIVSNGDAEKWVKRMPNAVFIYLFVFKLNYIDL